MDSRERVFLTLNHEMPDRIPTDFWASAGAWSIVTNASGMTPSDFLDYHDIDLRYIDGPPYTGRPLESGFDIWGVRRASSRVDTPYGTEIYSEVSESPLGSMSSPDQIDEYDGWPDPDDFDYSVVKKQATSVRDHGRVVVFMGDRLNRIAQLKPAMYLRGVEQILLDFALAPEIVSAIFSRIKTFYIKYLSRILDAAGGLIDIVLTGDDFGQQRGLLMSPDMWSNFIAPGFAAYVDTIHDYGAKSMHHTCGDVRLIVSRMHELGLDVLQSLQPEAMDDAYQWMKRELGAAMCFHGGISIQQTLPRGNRAEINEEVKQRVNVLGAGGGYFLGTAHNIQADCPYRNIIALLDAYARHGGY